MISNITTSPNQVGIQILTKFRCEGYKRLIEILTKEDGSGSHVFDVELPERIDDKEVFAEFRTALAGNKPSKKKKGKGGKKKKKK